MTSLARGTVMVISTIGIPPVSKAFDANSASSAEGRRTAGMMPISSMRVNISCLSAS